jgi:hypothetical protein
MTAQEKLDDILEGLQAPALTEISYEDQLRAHRVSFWQQRESLAHKTSADELAYPPRSDCLARSALEPLVALLSDGKADGNMQRLLAAYIERYVMPDGEPTAYRILGIVRQGRPLTECDRRRAISNYEFAIEAGLNEEQALRLAYEHLYPNPADAYEKAARKRIGDGKTGPRNRAEQRMAKLKKLLRLRKVIKPKRAGLRSKTTP